MSKRLLKNETTKLADNYFIVHLEFKNPCGIHYELQHSNQSYVEYVYGLLTVTKKFMEWNVRY